jgi:hypothetical protein
LLYDLGAQDASQTANKLKEHFKILEKIKNFILQNDILKLFIRGSGRPANDLHNLIT